MCVLDIKCVCGEKASRVLFARLLMSLFEHLHARTFVFADSRALRSDENVQTSRKHDYKSEQNDTTGR